MGLIKCRNCEKEFSDNNDFCPLCGTDSGVVNKNNTISNKSRNIINESEKSFINIENNNVILKPKKKKGKALKIIALILLTIIFGVGIGFIMFKVTGGKLVSNKYSNNYFSVKYKQDLIVKEEGNNVFFYVSEGKTPYLMISRYDQFKTSDLFFESFIPQMQEQYLGRGINIGTRKPISIGGKMLENVTMAYMMTGSALNDNRYVYSTGSRTWVFTMKEVKERGDNLYPILTQLVKSFKEV